MDMAALRRRPVRNESPTPQVVALRIEVGGTPRPAELGEGLCHRTGSHQGRRTCGVMRLPDGDEDPQGEMHRLQGDWPGGGPVEGDIRHNQSPDIVFHPVT